MRHANLHMVPSGNLSHELALHPQCKGTAWEGGGGLMRLRLCVCQTVRLRVAQMMPDAQWAGPGGRQASEPTGLGYALKLRRRVARKRPTKSLSPASFSLFIHKNELLHSTDYCLQVWSLVLETDKK